MGAATPADHAAAVTDMAERSMAAIRNGDAFDFTDASLIAETRDQGDKLRRAGFNHAPPAALIFIQRKLGGLYLLGARLGIRRTLRPALEARLP